MGLKVHPTLLVGTQFKLVAFAEGQEETQTLLS